MNGPTTVFIRSCSERTEGLCLESVRRELPDGWNIEVLRGICPAWAMYQEMFTRAVSVRSAFFFAVDADIVLSSGWSQIVQRAMVRTPKRPWFRTVFAVHDRVLDRIFSAGNHLYDGQHAATCQAELDAALNASDPEAARRARLKPEGTMTGRMIARGQALRYRRSFVGYHGHEQYLSEIYRRFRVRQAREPQFVKGLRARRLLDPKRQEIFRRTGDVDRLVANIAWNDMAFPPLDDNDARIAEAVRARLTALGISERAPYEKSLDHFLATVPRAARMRAALSNLTASFLR